MSRLPVNGYQLAYDHVSGRSPCVVFCAGFNSNRFGNKAIELECFCRSLGLEYIRFDYRAHGDSDGEFADSSVSQWREDTLAIIDHVATSQSIVLVGSSMGGWLALLAALARPQRVKGLLLIACAADMTRYYPARLEGLELDVDDQGRKYYNLTNDYDDQQPYRIYQQLIDDAEQWWLLDDPIRLPMPMRLLHGMQDDVVQWQRSQQVLQASTSKDVSLTLIKNGDHRLSREADLALIRSALQNLIASIYVDD